MSVCPETTSTAITLPLDALEQEWAALSHARGRAARFAAQHPQAESRVVLRCGGKAFGFQPELCRLGASRDPRRAALRDLALDVLAIRIKVLSDLAGLAPSSERGEHSLEGQSAERALLFDAALVELAFTLIASARIAADSKDPVEREGLQALRSSLSGLAEELGASVREESRAEARPVLATFVARKGGCLVPEAPPEPAPAEQVAVRQERATLGMSSGRSPAALARREELRSWILVLAGLLLPALIVVGASMLLQREPHPEGELVVDDFRSLAYVSALEDRPPNAFLTLRASGWGELDETGRLLLVDDAGAILGARGYQGALLYDEEGRVLAQWTERKGSQLFVE